MKNMIIKSGCILLVLLSPILFSSCFLLCDTRPVIMPQEGFSYSSNMFKDVACQIGIERYRNSEGNLQFSLWQCMKGDSSMSIKRDNIIIRHKGHDTPIKALRIQDTSKFRKWWKKYWMRENRRDWKKVKEHDFFGYAFMKIDFDRDIELGDSLQIIERDFPQKCDSVVIGIILPHALSKDDYLRSFYLDADLQFYRLKKEIEDKQN